VVIVGILPSGQRLLVTPGPALRPNKVISSALSAAFDWRFTSFTQCRKVTGTLECWTGGNFLPCGTGAQSSDGSVLRDARIVAFACAGWWCSPEPDERVASAVRLGSNLHLFKWSKIQPDSAQRNGWVQSATISPDVLDGRWGRGSLSGRPSRTRSPHAEYEHDQCRRKCRPCGDAWWMANAGSALFSGGSDRSCASPRRKLVECSAVHLAHLELESHSTFALCLYAAQPATGPRPSV